MHLLRLLILMAEKQIIIIKTKTMKTQFNHFLIICLVSTLFISNTFGQVAFHKSKSTSSFKFGDMLANPVNDGSLVEARVSQPALIAFSNSFPNVANTKWFRVDKLYLVQFMKNENVNKALYDVKGNLIYTICYGTEKDLPRDVRRLVRREYVGFEYNILQAIEVNEDNRNIWVINLSDDKSLITARVEDGIIEEVKHYRRSK